MNLYYFHFQSLYHPFLHILLRQNIKKQTIRQYTSYCNFLVFVMQIYFFKLKMRNFPIHKNFTKVYRKFTNHRQLVTIQRMP